MRKYAIVTLSILFIFGCGDNRKKDNPTGTAPLNKNEIVIGKEKLAMAEIKTGQLREMELSTELKCNGYVEIPAQAIFSIAPAMPGKLSQIVVEPGEFVQKSQVLAYIESPDIISLQQKFVESGHRLAYLEKTLARKEKLLASDAGSEKDFDEIRAEYLGTKSQNGSLGKQLELLGINKEQINENNMLKSIPLKAPLSGYVSAPKQNPGRIIGTQDYVFDIYNYDKLQLVLSVFEKDILNIQTGQQVGFRVAGYTKSKLGAKVISIDQSVDPVTKMVDVYCALDDKYEFLKHGMRASAQVFVDPVSCMTIEETAITREGENHFVFVDEGNGKFTKYPVETGRVQGIRIEIVSPVNKIVSVDVVVQGANYLAAELNKVEE